eukprot:CAMPEP_0174367642 /NCGR_PEP_ID=MMETSP0811_2-20130205/86119_1 /TAXON_ID=73025 ORGANISM="Eutreptiella gymnastica-like, Strain CCMP1594" /NCGR_SAMPLE_ID=MMETSP0811_2 /ASSEMBLY_ACC=CAM_ASM_000667 /LENGTH=48 /DNA_ID= /DNA_START= /DNA_END= /DNA_ORIENTATION=
MTAKGARIYSLKRDKTVSSVQQVGRGRDTMRPFDLPGLVPTEARLGVM